MDWRKIVKPVAEQMLVGIGRARRARLQNRGHVAVLAYHNVVPDGAGPVGDRSLHLPLARFRAQLDLLERHYEVVGLEGLDEASTTGRPRAAVTFDDAYCGALELGLPELRARGMPATVFVCPGRLGGGPFWWDRLAGASSDGLSADARHVALEDLEGRDDLVTERFGDQHDLGRVYLPATIEQLESAGRSPLVRFASHTWSHANLTRVDTAHLTSELTRCFNWMRDECPGSALHDHLSFPYGLWNDTVANAAADAGYRRLYLVDGGAARAPVAKAPGVVPRINVPSGISVHGFELLIAGARP